MIRLSGITKRFTTFSLHTIDLEINSGEYMVILGPSGAGKTVLLELIAGLLRPDSGRIEGMRGKTIGLIYQDYMLFPHLDVKGNVAYGLKMRKMQKKAIHRLVTSALEELGIGHLIDRDTKTLSGGEQQRVAIARAMVLTPDVYLFDEPTAALDVSNRRRTQELFLRLHRDHTPTVIHVTHDFEEALACGNRIAVLLDGSIIQVDTPQNLFNNPAHKDVADFFGYKNVFSGSIKDFMFQCGNVSITTPVQSAPDAHIAIRSNNIILSKEKLISSARNSFRARVVQIIHRTGYVEVTLDIGVSIHVDITIQSHDEMALKQGYEVWATFKTTAVKVFLH
jgi:molybdate/tungstate transport system ATP-binding protein